MTPSSKNGLQSRKQESGWYRKLAESSLEGDDYEPLCLWLIPVLLRSRKQYYADAVAKTKQLVEWYWKTRGPAFASRADFEKSTFLQQTWEREAPPWWGLNDIIGWIDVRLSVREREIWVSLFVPDKRISRNLKEKVYSCRLQERVTLPNRSTNEKLSSDLIGAVERVAAAPVIRGRCADLASWRRCVRHTDLIGIIHDTANAYLEGLPEGRGARRRSKARARR